MPLLLEKIRSRLGDTVLETHALVGDETVLVRKEKVVEVSRFLKEDRELDFNILMDLTAVDYLRMGASSSLRGCGAPEAISRDYFVGPKGPPRNDGDLSTASNGIRPVQGAEPHRFEVVYHFYSLAKNHRIRIKVPVGEEDPEVPSLTALWPIADWFEREVWDMFGIRFTGHPHLKRILMYAEFSGHPLRKDYPVNKRQPLVGPHV